jgi:hypothetical protein
MFRTSAFLATLPAALSQCPALPPLRSDSIQQGFDPSKLDGRWYEHAYIDIAQVGASCQILDSTFTPDDQKVTMDFKVKYIGQLLPFTIKEVYSPAGEESEEPLPGVYNKNAAMPGGSLLTLPTVVVDAGEGQDGLYDYVILYSCLDRLGPITDPWGQHVDEIVIATRDRSIDADLLESLKAKAHAQGVVFKDTDLQMVDHSKCDDAGDVIA